ncbi:MAG: flagellar biosynthesis protein FlhB [Proteobacteria bacterium]|nr:flagellar biosynthesis protein FlhB [Pseudomonadota bacterium]
MAEDSDQERTEEASPRKLEKTREEGSVPRSRDLDTFVLMMVIGCGLWVFGGNLMQQFAYFLTATLSVDRETLLDARLLMAHLGIQIRGVLLAFVPLVAVLIVAIIGTPALIGGWLFSAQALMPDFNRINPLRWLGNLFSSQSLMETFKAVAKSTLVGTVAWLVLQHQQEMIVGLAYEPISASGSHVASLLLTTYFSIVGSLGIIAFIDAAYQRWHYSEKLRMTREELRQESKESEGDPQVKGRIRAQQREMARRRMMAEVPAADVVVTNPAHFAVALKYDITAGSAPIVVAKGADRLAEKIREIAGINSIPIVEAPVLARSLYHHVKLGDGIPVGLYAAVAEVIAYVYQLRAYRQSGGLQPTAPEHFNIPSNLAESPRQADTDQRLDVTRL